MRRKHPPIKVRHDWQKATKETLERFGFTTPGMARGVYECPTCEGWTANLPLYRYEVCSAKDRSKGPGDRRKP